MINMMKMPVWRGLQLLFSKTSGLLLKLETLGTRETVPLESRFWRTNGDVPSNLADSCKITPLEFSPATP
ncbi:MULTISPECIES: hypothetical protein [Bacilli]|uniref:hypothetical protein n=1 Tax=Bacilli TaxID=91061 RepID=UPI0013DE6B6F|nr:hypothetical protein [Lacticaseibacillus yichunensis]